MSRALPVVLPDRAGKVLRWEEVSGISEFSPRLNHRTVIRHMPAISLWALAYTCFPDGLVVKKPPVNAGDLGLIPELGRSQGEGNGNPLQYSCLENPMKRGVWWVTVPGVAESQV